MSQVGYEHGCMGIDRSSGEPDEEPDRPREESRPGEPADYRESVQADLVAEALSGYKTARSASARKAQEGLRTRFIFP